MLWLLAKVPVLKRINRVCLLLEEQGQLLTDILKAIKFSRDEVFIGNIVKCRPPDNRTPLPEEMDTCIPYLQNKLS
jgi:uracil-DNA glycosylase family 4